MEPVHNPTEAAVRRYAAFISYCHHDRKWAAWLHRALEAYRIPKDLARADSSELRGFEALRPVFLDRAELTSSADLGESVRTALQQSAWLIVVCSPQATQSKWVNEEIRTFKEQGGEAKILCLVVDGDPAGEVGGRLDCFPHALRHVVEHGAVTSRRAAEPLAADIRAGKDGRRLALVKIVAAMLQIPLDRLRHREQIRQHRRLAVIAGASVLGCVGFGALAVAALYARTEAVRQRQIAEQQTLTTQRTADFLKSLFAVSDPSEARGARITAREVLDRGVSQVSQQLKDEPLVRADLSTTLGEVYASLGLLQDSQQLLKNAQSVPAQPLELAARQSVALGEVQYQRGDYDAALLSLTRARSLLERMPAGNAALRARMQLALGDVYNHREDYGEARRYFGLALASAAGDQATRAEVTARALEGMAQADLNDDQLGKARVEFGRALDARIAVSGEVHPRTAELTSEIGSLEYLSGHRSAAEKQFRKTLQIDTAILGSHHPELATTRNNLARVLLEQRHFAEARELLAASAADRGSQVVETEDTMAFLYSNLALADMGLGRSTAAEPQFQLALRAAIANKHRLHGPILTDLADLECRTGRYRAGLTRLAEARPIVAARYADDPWRTAHVDNVRAGCLTGMRRFAEATALMQSSLPVVLRKWPPDTLFGHDALTRATRLYGLAGDAARAAEYSAMLGEP